MNTTKKSLWAMTCLMCAALLLSTIFVACGSSEDSVDEPNKPKPEVPVADGDWQVVPATGGTIEKDDITIVFPSGTFSKETKVAITVVRKGVTIGEDDEASSFYQVTMPITTYKPITIKIQSARLSDDVHFVLQSRGFARSANKYINANNILETSYSDGSYIAKLPVFENEDETDSDYFTVGLAHIPSGSDGEAQVKTRASEVASGEVKGVKWKLYIDPTAKKVPRCYKVLSSYDYAKMNAWIRNAITQITDLGYELASPGTVIPYYYISEPDKWGFFKQDYRADCLSWIGISVEKLINTPNDTLSFKSTLLHETFHYFQANNYDNRCAMRKSGGTKWGWSIVNENILYEMGAAWIEKFTRKGKMDADWLRSDVFMGNLDKLGFEREEERWSIVNSSDNAEMKASKKNEAMQQQGYTMAPMLYYFTKEMDAFGFKDASVLELHNLWKAKWNSSSYTSYHILDEWVSKHDSFFFMSYGIDDYYLKLWNGKLIDNLDITSLYGKTDAKIDKFGKYPLTGQCYSYGCNVRRIQFGNLKNLSLKDAKLIVKQESPKVHTYLLLAVHNSQDRNYSFGYCERNGETLCIEKGDSMVIKGEALEKYKTDNGEMRCYLYAITTNVNNEMHSTTINPYEVTVELRDKQKEASVSPTELKFSAEGGTQALTVTSKDYKKYNYTISDEPKSSKDEKVKSWLSAKFGEQGKLNVTAQPNTTGKERVGYVNVYVYNEDNPNDKLELTPVKVTQAANEKQGDDTQSEFKIVSGRINMYYAVAWRHDMSFKAGDELSTITPKGKGANVKYVQSGRDTGANATWKITVTFDVDDLSLVNVQKTKLSNFKYVYERVQGEYNYYSDHVDYGREDATMESKVSKSQNANGIWYFEAGDLTYHQESMLHYDVWHKDAYSKAEEHTVTTETNTVTDGSYVSISLEVEKKK